MWHAMPKQVGSSTTTEWVRVIIIKLNAPMPTMTMTTLTQAHTLHIHEILRRHNGKAINGSSVRTNLNYTIFIAWLFHLSQRSPFRRT